MTEGKAKQRETVVDCGIHSYTLLCFLDHLLQSLMEYVWCTGDLYTKFWSVDYSHCIECLFEISGRNSPRFLEGPLTEKYETTDSLVKKGEIRYESVKRRLTVAVSSWCWHHLEKPHCWNCSFVVAVVYLLELSPSLQRFINFVVVPPTTVCEHAN